MKYRDFATRQEARSHDRARLRRLENARAQRPGEPPSRWKPAGTRESDGRAYPAGVWPGETPRPRKPDPRWRACDPIIGIATAAASVRRGRARLSGRFLARDDEDGDELPESEIGQDADEEADP